MKLVAAALVLLALGGCGGDLASPISAVAITWDANKQVYKLAQVRVNTLQSLRHLEGSTGTVTAGGAVRVSRAALVDKTATVDSLRKSFVTEGASRVELAWSVLNDIVYPENFDSLELLSAYYNLEKARAALDEWGLADLPAKPVIAHAKLTADDGSDPMAAGELYYAPLASFYLPSVSQVQSQQLPVAFNLGAVGHAIAHEAVQELVWGGKPVVPADLLPAGDSSAIEARHVARSVAEGLADFIGVAVSDDPAWFAHSIQQGASSRGLDQLPRCSSPDMLDALSVADTQLPYDPYPLGTVLAGALWEAQEVGGAGVQIVASRVLAALPELGKRAAAAEGKLSLADALDELAKEADDTVKPDLCGLFYNRFAQAGVRSLPSCAGIAVTAHPECQ